MPTCDDLWGCRSLADMKGRLRRAIRGKRKAFKGSKAAKKASRRRSRR